MANNLRRRILRRSDAQDMSGWGGEGYPLTPWRCDRNGLVSSGAKAAGAGLAAAWLESKNGWAGSRGMGSGRAAGATRFEGERPNTIAFLAVALVFTGAALPERAGVGIRSVRPVRAASTHGDSGNAPSEDGWL